MSKIQQNKEADIYKILIYCVFHLINGNVKWNATCTSKFPLIDICGFIWNVILFMVWKKRLKIISNCSGCQYTYLFLLLIAQY